jgi:hypothetical protein
VRVVDDPSIPDTTTHGIGRVERLADGRVRLTYYAGRCGDDGQLEFHTVAKLVLAIDTIPEIMRTMNETIIGNGWVWKRV